MPQKHRSGKLAVILHADIAGSTLLVRKDERVAHERIQDAFRRFGETITTYHGHVREVRGDALLAEFERVSDAVSAAIAFQAAQSSHNDQLNDEIRPRLRIGIAMGEVVVADDTVTGAGVVLAQRVEQLTEPGGVCITAAIHEALPERMPFDQDDLGEQEIKGFDEAIRVYRVGLKAEALIPSPQESSQPEAPPKKLGLIAAVSAIVLVLAGGVVYWFQPWVSVNDQASVEGIAYPLPDKPSIAVLPFDNLGGDPEQGYFADGMTEDLITDLSKIEDLFVIARNSAFTYKGKSIDVRKVAQDLGVRYVLEGSVRRSGEQVRINAQLIDATTGGHVWADRYDGTLENVFGLQDEVTRNIVTVLAVQLTAGDEDRIAYQETGSAEAYDVFLQGWQHYLRQTPEDFVLAIGHFNKAVELDPQYSRAYAALAATYWETSERFWQESVGLARLHDASFLAEQALAKAMENPTPLAHQVSAAMLLNMQQHDEAIAEARRAIALDPNDADSFVTLAGALSLAGQPNEALKQIEHAMRLNPYYPPSYLYELGVAQFALGELEKAAAAFEKAIALNLFDRWSYRLLVATYGLLDRAEDASRALDAIDEIDKRGKMNYFDPFTIRTSTFWVPFKDPTVADRLVQGLRSAGVPD